MELGISTTPTWLPPEVWTMVGEQIVPLSTLKALVLTCQQFKVIFTPLLHANRVFEIDKLSSTKLTETSLPPILHHTKALKVLLMNDRRKYKVKTTKIYAAYLVKMLKAIPSLQSFAWRDWSFSDKYVTARILKNDAVLKMLKEYTTLRSLSIEFANEHLDPERPNPGAENCWFRLQGFKNLTSLELYGFYAETSRLVKDITNVLSTNTHLKKLGLSRVCEVDVVRIPEVLVWRGTTDFLQDLCDHYASHPRTSPLALNTLRLGHGMLFYKRGVATSLEFLGKLVNLSGLETLHVFNGLVKSMDGDGSEDNVVEAFTFDWTFLSKCSLRQLSVSRLENDTLEWLNSNGRSVEELIVTDHCSAIDVSTQNLGKLKLPNLSMLVTRECLLPRPYDQYMTVVERHGDLGGSITRLGICLDFGKQWERFVRQLPHLKHLTHLRIDSFYGTTQMIPTATSSLWPGVMEYRELGRRYARLMKLACPSLKYIKIGLQSWEATTPPAVTVAGITTQDDLEGAIYLRHLEYREILEIELFAMDSFVVQSGLPGPDEWHEPNTEEEQEVMDRQLEIINVAIRDGRDVEEAVDQAIEAGIIPPRNWRLDEEEA